MKDYAFGTRIELRDGVGHAFGVVAAHGHVTLYTDGGYVALADDEIDAIVSALQDAKRWAAEQRTAS